MKYFIYALLTLQSAAVLAEPLQVCYSQCLGVSSYRNELRFLGNLSGIAKSRVGAWRELNQKCLGKAKRNGLMPILAEGTLVYEHDRSWSSYSWSDFSSNVTHSFYYTSVSRSSSASSSFYQNDVMKLQVNLAKPELSCALDNVDMDEMEDYYDGDLPVQG